MCGWESEDEEGRRDGGKKDRSNIFFLRVDVLGKGRLKKTEERKKEGREGREGLVDDKYA